MKDNKNIVNEELSAKSKPPSEVNMLPTEVCKQLRKKKRKYPLSEKINNRPSKRAKKEEPTLETSGKDVCDVSPHPREYTKKVDFKKKLFLAPLTTVGNLPFRKICKQYGADITCGEMAMAVPLLQGKKTEWALLRRDPSEDVFGVQLCGSNVNVMARAAELLSQTIDVDFIDLNIGCPIDMVFRKGAGSALLGRTAQLESIVRGVASVSKLPVTIKLRTGLSTNKPTIHENIIPNAHLWGADAITVHGRTRAQRYLREADWGYIKQCADIAQVPLVGNGDIYSFTEAIDYLENSKVSSLMLARGAIIKPWIFTEIKEKRHWDISSHERFEMLKNFVGHGLYHWGSDTRGVFNTRYFLLNWLSFLCRYTPVGVLERGPIKMNSRPPAYVARDDLEKLMGSEDINDWVTISEMLLGPIENKDSFKFEPKHKANAYEDNG